MAIGVGTCAGPLLGALINAFIGYKMTFVCLAFLIFTSFVIAVLKVPAKLNFSNEKLMQSNNEKKNIPYYYFVTNKNALLLVCTAIIAVIFESYVDPIIGVQLLGLGLPDKSVEYAFAMIGGAFGLGALVAGKLC